MSTEPPISSAELSAESLRRVGELVCLYAELEMCIRRFTRILGHTGASPTATVSRCQHRFRSPLRTLTLIIRARYAEDSQKLRKFSRWRNRMKRLTRRRNAMIHGVWLDDCGALCYRTYARDVDSSVQEVCGILTAQQLARDMRVLRLDIAAIKAWLEYCSSDVKSEEGSLSGSSIA
jgi:hypothetical protein